MITSHPHSTVEASDEAIGKNAIDITLEKNGKDGSGKTSHRDLRQGMNVTDSKFKNVEDFTLEETDNIRKELEGLQRAEFEMKEAITSLECQLMEFLNTKEIIASLERHLMKVLGTIETLMVEVKALKEGVEVR